MKAFSRPPLSRALALVALLAGPVSAESPAFPDFTFKRVKPPSGEVGKRITVQVSPQDMLRPPPKKKKQEDATVTEASAVAAGVPTKPIGRHDWFWQSVSPAIVDSGPGRLEPALISLSKPPNGGGVSAPRLDSLLKIVQAYGSDILLNTAGTQVSPALVVAVIAVESGGRADAVSGAGATGLMQLMPATAERFGVTDRTVPAANIRGGIAYLNLLMHEFKGDPILVLAGYNAGENSVIKFNGVPPYAETRDYVPKVLAAFEVARGLCMTRPQLVSDGCVFSIPS